MDKHGQWQLRNPEMPPDDALLEEVLGDSYAAYEALQGALPQLEMEQAWQWYTPHKAWLAKGQHFWKTPRGTHKEKTLYWLHVFGGYFDIAIWFKEKNRAEVLRADVSDHTKALVYEAETMGKLPTFPVILKVTAAETLNDVYALMACKKSLER